MESDEQKKSKEGPIIEVEDAPQDVEKEEEIKKNKPDMGISGLAFIGRAIKKGASTIRIAKLKQVNEATIEKSCSEQLGQSSSESSVSNATNRRDSENLKDTQMSVEPLRKKSGEPEHQILKKQAIDMENMMHEEFTPKSRSKRSKTFSAKKLNVSAHEKPSYTKEIAEPLVSAIRRKTNEQQAKKKSSRRIPVFKDSNRVVRPAEHLMKKEKIFEGNYNTMSVFDSLPSMYTEEKWEELKEKKRSDLKFEHLYWLSRFEPQNRDGYFLEKLINFKIDACRTHCLQVINPMQTAVVKLGTKMTSFDETMSKFRNEVANIMKLRQQMHTVIEDQMEIKSAVQQLQHKQEEYGNKINNSDHHFTKKMAAQEAKFQKLEEYVHRPTNFVKMMKAETKGLEDRFEKTLQELNEEIQEKNLERVKETQLFKEWVTKTEEFYKLNSSDIKDLRTDQATAHKKFDLFERVMVEFNLNIEALKTHALATDLHLESSLPLQIASIAFEVGMGATMKKQYPKYRKNFSKRLKQLEKNFQDCSDPFIEVHNSVYRKNFYELPEEYLNPTKVGQNEDSQDGSFSRSKDKRLKKGMPPSVQDLSLNELHNEMQSKSKRRSNSRASNESPRGGQCNISDITNSIPGQLIKTLQKWQPVNQQWTLKMLYQSVSKSVTDFLKIPMMEMSSEEFYSVYMDSDQQELGTFKPLPQFKPQNEEDQLQSQDGSQQHAHEPENQEQTEQQEKHQVKFGGNESENVISSPKIDNTGKPPQSALKKSALKKKTVSMGATMLAPLVSTPLQVAPPRPKQNAFSRLQGSGGLQDPRALAQQQKIEKADQLAQQAERRKLQEQVTDAVSNVIQRFEIFEKMSELKMRNQTEEIKKNKDTISKLKEELSAEKELNLKRNKDKNKAVIELNEKIEAARLKVKKLVGELEESFQEQVKIPQLQLLHTEYQRLKEVEQKGVDSLLKRKLDIKAAAAANGGRVVKDDGAGVQIRKDLTATRSKLKIVQKKIRKYGALGKIPMGASMRVYQENSDSESSSMSSSTEEVEQASLSSFGSSDNFKKQRLEKETKRKREVLESGLVYQPKFKQVVKMSSKALPNYNNLDSDSASRERRKILSDQSSKKSSAFQLRQGEELAESLGPLSEVESVSDSNGSERIDSTINQTCSPQILSSDLPAIREKSSGESANAVIQKIREPPSKKRSSSQNAKFQSSETVRRVMAQFGTNQTDALSPDRPVSSNCPRSPVKQQIFNHMNTRNSQNSQISLKDQQKEERKIMKSQIQLTKTITFRDSKMSNKVIRDQKKEKRRQKTAEAECQTDPIEIGDIQLDLSDDGEKEQKPFALENVMLEKGIDAPKFIILNVVPGRPISVKKEEEPVSRIQKMVQDLKIENDRKGVSNLRPDLSQINEKFSLQVKDNGLSEEIIEIKNSQLNNREVFIAYEENQKKGFFQDMLGDQISKSRHSPIQDFDLQSDSPRKLKSSAMQQSFGVEKSRNSNAKSSRGGNKKDRDEDVKSRASQGKSTKAKSMRGGMKKDRDQDTKSRASGKTTKSRRTKKSTNKSVMKSQKSRREKSNRGLDNSAKKDNQLNLINNNLENGVNDSFIGSSFDASLSDDDDSDEEDEFVTFDEFKEFQDQSKKQIDELKKVCNDTIHENMRVIKKIDNVDWSIINKAETKLSQILGDFQLTVDSVLYSIEADIKKWKTKQAELTTKNEIMEIKTKNLFDITNFIKEEFFANSDDNWIQQQELIKFTQMQVGLEQADEIDKQNISLVGQKEVTGGKNQDFDNHDHQGQTISFDPACKGCQCTTNVERTAMLHNLKLACLMYQPSQVNLPAIQRGLMDRKEVVEMQKQTIEVLQILSQKRKSRVEQFKMQICQLEIEIQEKKMPTQEEGSGNPIFLQNTEEKTFQQLNYFGLQEIANKKSRHQNLNITITNNNTNVVMSPSTVNSESPIQQARWQDSEATRQNGESPNMSQIHQSRKPILQGKIDSRAVAGLKKNLNTASNFSQVNQNNNFMNATNGSSFVRLSHKSSANINRRAGEQKYHIQSLEPPQKRQKAQSRVEGQILKLGQKVISSTISMQKQKPTQQVQNSSTKRRFMSSIPRQSSSPKEFRDQKIDFSDVIEAQNDIPLTSRRITNTNQGNRLSQEIQGSAISGGRLNSDSELPELKRNQQNKSGTQDWSNREGKTINISLQQANQQSNSSEIGRKQLNKFDQQLNKESTKSLSQVSRNSRHGGNGTEMSFTHDGGDYQFPTTGIKVEVRNSNIFRPSSNQRVTDQEIRNVRRNVVNTVQSRRSQANGSQK